MRKVFVLAALVSALSVFASAASADRDGRYYNGKYEDYYDGHGITTTAAARGRTTASSSDHGPSTWSRAWMRAS